MRAVYAFPRYLVYAVEHSKFEASLIFYGCIIVALLQLFSVARTVASNQHFPAVSLPYSEILPHGTPLEPANIPVTTAAMVVPSTGSVWPIHGIVTTEFGAPDYPFQSHHSGIDISSARRAGITAVGAFRSGTVITVIHSDSSYGNHVIIDHGGGMTSLYGHLYSTAVSQGQRVRPGDSVGTEGSTGASTGPHVHFEIRQDGTPQNPRLYIVGNP